MNLENIDIYYVFVDKTPNDTEKPWRKNDKNQFDRSIK